jgi:hypothetical protein
MHSLCYLIKILQQTYKESTIIIPTEVEETEEERNYMTFLKSLRYWRSLEALEVK